MTVQEWFTFVLHNTVIHPLLPLAVMATASPWPVLQRVGEAVFRVHDKTAPIPEG